jgi:hypothetical protein
MASGSNYKLASILDNASTSRRTPFFCANVVFIKQQILAVLTQGMNIEYGNESCGFIEEILFK